MLYFTLYLYIIGAFIIYLIADDDGVFDSDARTKTLAILMITFWFIGVPSLFIYDWLETLYHKIRRR